MYRTPPKSKKLQEESLETTRLSSSQPKLNYSRSEQKFKTEEIFKLRKRAGVKWLFIVLVLEYRYKTWSKLGNQSVRI